MNDSPTPINATVWVRVTSVTSTPNPSDPNAYSGTATGIFIPISGPITVCNSCTNPPHHRVILRQPRGTPVNIIFVTDPAQPQIQDTNGAVTWTSFLVQGVVPKPVYRSISSSVLSDQNGTASFTITFGGYDGTNKASLTATWDPGVDNESPP